MSGIQLEDFLRLHEVMRIFRTAVRKARAEGRRLGVPNAFSFGGRIYYELPDGRLVPAPERPSQQPGSATARPDDQTADDSHSNS